MASKKKGGQNLKDLMAEGKRIVVESGAQVKLAEEELIKIKKEEKEIWQRLSFLL